MNLPALSSESLLKQATSTAQPTVAMVFPFEPKMTPKAQLDLTVKRLLETAEKELLGRHAAGEAMPVIKRLQQSLRGLNYSTHKRSVALWVSASKTGIVYMDFPVVERLFIDQPFRIRDLAGCKPAGKEYLLLLLTGKESKTYICGANGLKLIKNNGPQTVYAHINEPPERTGNFSDPETRHEVMTNKFLHHMDQGLAHVLKAYPLPVFVAGAAKITGHFSRITRHSRHIAGYVHKHCIHDTGEALETMLQPLIANWQQLRNQLLFRQMEKAWEAGKLVCGIEEVQKAARSRNGRVVILETGETSITGFHTEGPLDQIIEKVVLNGGDIEVLAPGSLGRFGPVALIRYY